MYPKGWMQKFWEAAFMMLAIPFILHLAAYWLAPLAPIFLVLFVLGIVYLLVFGRRRR